MRLICNQLAGLAHTWIPMTITMVVSLRRRGSTAVKVQPQLRLILMSKMQRSKCITHSAVCGPLDSNSSRWGQLMRLGPRIGVGYRGGIAIGSLASAGSRSETALLGCGSSAGQDLQKKRHQLLKTLYVEDFLHDSSSRLPIKAGLSFQ